MIFLTAEEYLYATDAEFGINDWKDTSVRTLFRLSRHVATQSGAIVARAHLADRNLESPHYT